VFQNVRRTIGRLAIRDDHFYIRIVLCLDAFQASGQNIRSVVSGYNDGDFHASASFAFGRIMLSMSANRPDSRMNFDGLWDQEQLGVGRALWLTFSPVTDYIDVVLPIACE
jgi:hypothetical protein